MIHQKTTEIKYNKTPSKGMSPVVVAHHSIAAGGGCPVHCSSLLAGCHCWVLVPFVALVKVLILICAWFIVVACWIGRRCRCGVACHYLLAGAGSSVMVVVLASFASSPVLYRSSSLFVVVTPSPIPVVCRSPSPSPVIRFPSVVALPSIL